jgi:hypothetical protein
MLPLDNEPNNHGDHLGSAYQDGWWGYISRDLRSILGLPVTGSPSRIYCGGGSLNKCRTDLRKSLKDALALTDAQLYDEDPGTAGTQRVSGCPASSSNQWCYDSVKYRTVGVLAPDTFHWINRPTFQQAVEIQGHRPR